MIMYFSGGGVRGVWEPTNRFLLENNAARLVSFEYAKLAIDYCSLAAQYNRPFIFLLDSGAFSAWSKGSEVDIHQLAEFYRKIKATPGIQPHLINLDVIPGEKGRDPTPQEVSEGMQKSVDNYNYLNSLFPGEVLPVYHQGEPTSFRDYLLSCTHYICLSPRNDLHENKRVEWIREVTPKSKDAYTHGLATTGSTMMQASDWWSVDSASWVFTAGMGNIMWKTEDNRIITIPISSISPSRKTINAHVSTLAPITHDAIRQLIRDKGYNYDEMCFSDKIRYVWNADVMLNYVPNVQIIHTQVLFDA